MQLPASLNNNTLFRLVWWVLTLPLEAVRLVAQGILPIMRRIGTPIRVGAIMLLFYYDLTSPNGRTYEESDAAVGRIILVLFFGVLSIGVRRQAIYPPIPRWRLGYVSPRQKSSTATPTATVVPSLQHGKKQSRATITARLSPELQALMAG
jgi:hypothetical protein